MLRTLGAEVLDQQFDLAPLRCFGNRHEKIRLPHVAVPFRNLVLEDQLVSEGIPCEIGNDPVILMPIVTSVGEHYVGFEFARECFKGILDCPELSGKISVIVDCYFQAIQSLLSVLREQNKWFLFSMGFL